MHISIAVCLLSLQSDFRLKTLSYDNSNFAGIAENYRVASTIRLRQVLRFFRYVLTVVHTLPTISRVHTLPRVHTIPRYVLTVVHTLPTYLTTKSDDRKGKESTHCYVSVRHRHRRDSVPKEHLRILIAQKRFVTNPKIFCKESFLTTRLLRCYLKKRS